MEFNTLTFPFVNLLHVPEDTLILRWPASVSLELHHNFHASDPLALVTRSIPNKVGFLLFQTIHTNMHNKKKKRGPAVKKPEWVFQDRGKAS